MTSKVRLLSVTSIHGIAPFQFTFWKLLETGLKKYITQFTMCKMANTCENVMRANLPFEVSDKVL